MCTIEFDNVQIDAEEVRQTLVEYDKKAAKHGSFPGYEKIVGAIFCETPCNEKIQLINNNSGCVWLQTRSTTTFGVMMTKSTLKAMIQACERALEFVKF